MTQSPTNTSPRDPSRLNTTLRGLSAGALIVLAPCLVVVARAVYGGDTPDPLPTHWNLHGAPDGFTSAQPFFVACLVVTLVAAVLGMVGLAFARSSLQWRWACIASAWVAWLGCTVYSETVIAAHGASAASHVRLGAVFVVALILLPTAVATALGRLAPRVAVVGPRVAGSVPASLHLSATERVTWIGRVESRWLLVTSAVVGAVAVGLVFVQVTLAIAAFVVAAAFLVCALVVVRIDDDGVRVGFGPLHWPAVSVALDDIASARAQFVEPLRSGGWGYRFTPKGRAVVVRRGEGLLLERTNGQDFVVTVDGADEAAEVTNALVARRLDATRLRGNA